jgi:anion-transporting  ArsA/GET3 family ATPase
LPDPVPRPPTPPFAHRLLVVHGKGGVGRTTVAAALGLAAARSGRRTCVIELGGQRALAGVLGFAARSYAPRGATENLDVMSLAMVDCLIDFGRRRLRLPLLSRWVMESRLVTEFVDAVPGIHDLVQLGKVEYLITHPAPGEPVYDLVILDAPATGHGLTLLDSATTIRRTAQVGPLAELSGVVERFLADRSTTGHLLVVLPERLPVQEGLELAATLAAQGLEVGGVVLNRVLPPALPSDEAGRRLEAHLEGATPGSPLGELADLIEHAAARHDRQRLALADLRGGLPKGLDVVTLPERRPRPVGVEGLGPLAQRLAALGSSP